MGLACGVILALGLAAPAPQQPAAETGAAPAGGVQSAPDPMAGMVLSKMHQMNQMEIKAGELAASKGASDDVRAYGDRLARDHRFADKKVVEMAQRSGASLSEPQPKNEMEKKDMEMQMMQKLQTLSGPEFDKAFVEAMIMGHDKAISMLTDAHEKAKDPQLKGFLGKMIPILEQHRDVAQQLTQQAQS